jgi:diaminohydroxyphosphoribosylaminopyrimidine deaminase/5-amino-6-(5-phosphoribosylamino)uracil reductase
VGSAAEAPVLVVAAAGAPEERVRALEGAGVEVLPAAGGPAERIGAALDELGRRAIQSLFLEGGARLAAAFVAAGAVDRVAWVLAPVLIGGADAPGALADVVAPTLAEAPRLRGVEVARVGEDTVLTGRLRPLPA